MNWFFLFVLEHIILIPSLEVLPVEWEQWKQPSDLSNIKKIFRSGKINDDKMPIIAYSNVFFLQNGDTKVYNIKDGRTSFLVPQYNLEPILYTNTVFNSKSLFMARECIIYIFEERGKNTNQYSHLSEIDLKKVFGSCYYSLKIYYEHKTGYAAIYNYYQSKDIIVLDLEKFKKYGNIYDSQFVKIKNDYLILQSLIYSNKEGDKSILIVKDNDGIKFYNLKGCSSSWFGNNPGELIQSKKEGYTGLIDFIDGDKLLFATMTYFKVFKLNDPIKIIYEQNYALYYGDYIKCLLSLKDGNVLIGSNLGYIYLISFDSGSLKIIDDEKICDDPVYSLSYTNNCNKGDIYCYTFAANCGRVLIFQIWNKDKTSKNTLSNSKSNNDNKDFNVGITFILIIFICIIICCNCKTNNNRDKN